MAGRVDAEREMESVSELCGEGAGKKEGKVGEEDCGCELDGSKGYGMVRRIIFYKRS